MLNSVVAAQVPHDFIFRGWEVQCPGNPLSHTILRGAVNKHGQTIPNYHYEDLRLLYELYMKRNLKNPACIVDTNHSNSGKRYMEADPHCERRFCTAAAIRTTSRTWSRADDRKLH